MNDCDGYVRIQFANPYIIIIFDAKSNHIESIIFLVVIVVVVVAVVIHDSSNLLKVFVSFES